MRLQLMRHPLGCRPCPNRPSPSSPRSSSRPRRSPSAETHRFVPERFYNTFSWRASAGAAHQAGRPGDHQDHRCRRHGLERQERGVRAQPADRAVLRGRRRARRHAGGVDREDRDQPRRRLSGSLLAPYALDPAAIGQRVDREARRVTWKHRQGPRCGHPLGAGHHAGPGAAAAADARLRRRGAGAQGSHRHEHAGRLRRQHGLRRPGRRREGDAAGERTGRAAVHRRRPCPTGRGRGRRAPGSRRRWTSSSRSSS